MARSEPGPWQKELDDFGRAIFGAFLFGIPLLFTMEMWSLGASASTAKLLAVLGLTFVANLGLAYFAGFKRETTFRNNVDEAIDAMAVGIVTALVILLVLNRVSLGDPLASILGKIAVQTVPLSLGASIANAVFAGRGGRQGDDGPLRQIPAWRAILRDVGATIVGGLFLSLSVAPTDEIGVLAAELTVQHELALIGLSLLISYVMVFVSGFDPELRRPNGGGLFRHPASETAMAYAISLAVAFATLYVFGGVTADTPPSSAISQSLVLGLPAAIGGAAGRLVI
jgi:putative integral membrane protein (TIGR02587 family)